MSRKKSTPALAPAPKTARYRMETPARERMTVTTKLEPATHQKLVKAARANRTSISTETETRIEKSFEPDLAQPSNDLLVPFGANLIHAFRMGGQLENVGRAPAEWMRERLPYNRGLLRLWEASMDWHPGMTLEDFDELNAAFVARVHAAFLTAEKTATSGVFKRSHLLPEPSSAEGDNETRGETTGETRNEDQPQ